MRWSTVRFIRPVCSGEMYAMVPSSWLGLLASCVSRGSREAMPKSMSLTAPEVSLTTTLLGFTSLWTMPAPCTPARASASFFAIGRKRERGIGPLSSARSETPPTSSTMSAGRPRSCSSP